MSRKRSQADLDRKVTGVTMKDCMEWVLQIQSDHRVLVKLHMYPASIDYGSTWRVEATAYTPSTSAHLDELACEAARYVEGEGRTLQGLVMYLLMQLSNSLDRMKDEMSLPF